MTESKGYLYAFLCSILTAFWIVLIKWVQESIPPQSVLFLTQAAAALALTTLLPLSGGLRTLKRHPPTAWAWLLGVAGLTYFAYWSLFEAIDRLDPTVASFVGRA